MVKLIIFVAFVANFHSALADTTAFVDTANTDTREISPIIDDGIDDSKTRIRCGPNQIYDFCPSLCPPKTCKNKDAVSNCLKRPNTDVFICSRPRCRCADGFYSTDDGKCVKKEECPPQCGRNEVPSDCATNPCLPTCDEPERNTYCKPNPANCKPGCVCADGYVRDGNGICVPKEKCTPPIDCGINEVYYSCPGPICINQTCENIDKVFTCPIISTEYRCKGECRCKDGYYRNEIGQCITEEECRKCPGENEYFACDNECDNECDKLHIQSHANCPIVNVKCYPKCYCLEGFARNNEGKCIPISQCPPICKDMNEEYTNCTNQGCRAQTCKEIGYPLQCLQLDRVYECGKPGCICKGGYVRNEDNVCIPVRNCTSCGGDENAVSGCGTYCTRCSNYKNQNRVCLLSCVLNGCDCREGYVYDDNNKKCVLPEECPPIKCGENEVVSDCANSPCIRNCRTIDMNLACRPYPPGCQSGCICAEGYLRDDKGVCVPKEKCPNRSIYNDDTVSVKAA